MNTGTLKLYDFARHDLHLPDKKAREFVTTLGEFSEMQLAKRDQDLATKTELLAVRTDLLAVKNELKQEIHAVATRLDLMATKEELSDVKIKLTESIHNTENRLTKSIYTATLVQVLILIVSVCTILKYAGILK